MMKNCQNRFAVLMSYDDIENIDIDIDRIRNLPDELLCHILSYLPIKLAFSTTILSKTWTASLYQSLTSLYFDDEPFRSHDHCAFFHFSRFVNTVTLSTKVIKSFHLNFRNNKPGDHYINSWIETAKRHPVEILEIRMWHNSLSHLSPSNFIFPTLVILQLEWVNIVGDISADLPSLRTLHLNIVSFNNKKNFHNLLYGCPVLEDLQAIIHYVERNQHVKVGAEEFKSLSKLITAEINAFDVPFNVIPNVKILTLMIFDKPPNIKSYYPDFSIFQNLINLDLRFDNFHYWDVVVEILQYCPKLQILSFYKWTCYTREKYPINWKHPNSVPECISSRLRSCTINYGGVEDELQFAKYILHNAPLLEVMKIKINDLYPKPSRSPLEELFLCPMISPQCKLSISP